MVEGGKWLESLATNIRKKCPLVSKFGARVVMTQKGEWLYTFDDGENDVRLESVWDLENAAESDFFPPYSALCSGFVVKTNDPMRLIIDGIIFNPQWTYPPGEAFMRGVVIRGLPIMHHTLDFERALMRSSHYDIYAIAPYIQGDVSSSFLLIADNASWHGESPSLFSIVRSAIFRYEMPNKGMLS